MEGGKKARGRMYINTCTRPSEQRRERGGQRRVDLPASPGETVNIAWVSEWDKLQDLARAPLSGALYKDGCG